MASETLKSDPIPWNGTDILAATGGTLVSGDRSCRFTSVSIDSRSLPDNALFTAIVGRTHDGHRFCRDVVDAGVRGLMVNTGSLGSLPVDEWRDRAIFCMAVADTTRALGDMAAWRRDHHRARVAAVTGSCGKTTTRDMAASVLNQRFHTLSSRKNFNNEIGLPLTLLALEEDHEWVVAELGMNRPGEIARLGGISRPDIGVITNIGPAHLEGLGSMENVMAAKGELLPAINPKGTAVLNADDPRGRQLAESAGGRVLMFGEAEDADICGRGVVGAGIGTAFELVLPTGGIPVSLSVPGRFMVSNALAAAAVGHLAGLSAGQIKAGLEAFRPIPGRMSSFKTPRGVHILDDSYNANPASMVAAIDTLTGLRGNHRGVVVSGDMLELGDRSKEFHRDIGLVAARSGAERIYASGEFADALAAGAREGGMGAEQIVTGDLKDILSGLKTFLLPGDWVLVKGSRGARMERVVSELARWTGKKK